LIRTGCRPALALAGLVGLAACAVPQDQSPAARASLARPPLDAVLARLPEQSSGFTRGMTTDMEASQPGQGRAVDYATLAAPGLAARAAIASVIVYDHGQPPLPADTPAAVIDGKLNEGVAEATAPAPARRMAETGRRALPVPGGAPLQCATVEGSYGRTAMWQQVCVGVAAGRFVKVFIAVPARQRELLTDVDADAFSAAVAAALRGGAAPAA
jgi:hypothetical protein